MKLLIIAVALLFIISFHSCLAKSCKEFDEGNYTELERLLLTDDNIVQLEEAFFPTNAHFSVVVDVYYHIYFRLPTEAKPEIKHAAVLQDSKVYNERNPAVLKRDITDLEEELFVVHFKWLSSSVNLFTRPELLQKLSLMTYRVNSIAVDLNFEVPCPLEISPTETCAAVSELVRQLNDITSNLKSYALHHRSVLESGMKLSDEKGYSAYIFANDTESDYCAIDQEDWYVNLRLYVNIGGMLLIFAIMIAAPITLVAVYDYLCEKVKDNMLFFLWSLMLVSAVAACAMIVFDAFTIVYNIPLYPSSPYHDILIYFIAFTVILGVIIIVDFVFMVLAMIYIRPSTQKVVHIPELLNFFRKVLFAPCRCCLKCQKEGDPEGGEGGYFRKIRQSCCSECLMLLFGSYFFTLFLQLSSFHFLYIVLGAICTPVESISISTFYIACFFCFVAFIAIILKSTNDKNYFETFKCINVCKCLLPLLAAGLFVASICLFIGYFYNYTIMVQSYSNNGGFLAIVGSILPSILVSLGGFAGTRLIKYIEDPSGQKVDDAASTIKPGESEQPPADDQGETEGNKQRSQSHHVHVVPVEVHEGPPSSQPRLAPKT